MDSLCTQPLTLDLLVDLIVWVTQSAECDGKCTIHKYRKKVCCVLLHTFCHFVWFAALSCRRASVSAMISMWEKVFSWWSLWSESFSASVLPLMTVGCLSCWMWEVDPCGFAALPKQKILGRHLGRGLPGQHKDLALEAIVLPPGTDDASSFSSLRHAALLCPFSSDTEISEGELHVSSETNSRGFL